MALITKPNTFSAGATIIASEHNSNFDTIYSEFNGNVTNTNIHTSAAIAATKLNLSTIAQAIIFGGSTTFAGTTIASLGTVTTADINGGTVDGTIIGGSSAANGTFTNLTANTTLKLGSTNQGDILYDNGTSLVRLTPGTSGQFLKTLGAAANPAWGNGGLSLISTTTGTGTNTGDIAVDADSSYFVTIELLCGGTDSAIVFAFNSDTTGTDYEYIKDDWDMSAGTNSSSTSAGAASVPLGTMNLGEFMHLKGFLNTTDNGSLIHAWGELKGFFSGPGGGDHHMIDIGYFYNGGAVTNFELQLSQSTTFTVKLYKYQ